MSSQLVFASNCLQRTDCQQYKIKKTNKCFATEISEITVLIYLCSRLIIVDVSYDSVLGNIVWTGDGG